VRTLKAFGDEWTRFPDLLAVHRSVFRWYFEGQPPHWQDLRVLDAGCGMGRWLHFAVAAGAKVVGMDVSPAIDVAAAREDGRADFVQADLRVPPFREGSFDLVYSLGVLHHLEDPEAGLRALAELVRPGGELRLYVYRTLEGESWVRRTLLSAVTGVRTVTTRLPFPLLHAFSWTVAAVATALFLWPRRLLRQTALGDRLTRGLPLAQYSDAPFRMLVAEQVDRFGAPIEHRYRREEVHRWIESLNFELLGILPELGWRAIARRPLA
jgi:SAM-dependent methyltransferase